MGRGMHCSPVHSPCSRNAAAAMAALEKLRELEQLHQAQDQTQQGNLELVQRLYQEMQKIDSKVDSVMSINHNPLLMQKQVAK